MDRREAIKALTGAALTPIAPCAAAAAGEREVRLHVDPDHTLATIPAGFLGLGYEFPVWLKRACCLRTMLR
jgi:hypothetical protein